MRKRLPVSIALLLAACGGAASTSNNASAEAAAPSAKERAAADKKKADDALNSWSEFERAIESGGTVSCFDPNLSGRERAVAERLGGVPCKTEGRASGAASGAGWAGTYEGAFDGGGGQVILKGPSRIGNNYNAELSVAGGGCSGQASASAAPRGNIMTLEIPTGSTAESNAGLCRITMTLQGNTLRVRESGCAELHGMSCGFSGSAMKRAASIDPLEPSLDDDLD